MCSLARPSRPHIHGAICLSTTPTQPFLCRPRPLCMLPLITIRPGRPPRPTPPERDDYRAAPPRLCPRDGLVPCLGKDRSRDCPGALQHVGGTGRYRQAEFALVLPQPGTLVSCTPLLASSSVSVSEKEPSLTLTNQHGHRAGPSPTGGRLQLVLRRGYRGPEANHVGVVLSGRQGQLHLWSTPHAPPRRPRRVIRRVAMRLDPYADICRSRRAIGSRRRIHLGRSGYRGTATRPALGHGGVRDCSSTAHDLGTNVSSQCAKRRAPCAPLVRMLTARLSIRRINQTSEPLPDSSSFASLLLPLPRTYRIPDELDLLPRVTEGIPGDWTYTPGTVADPDSVRFFQKTRVFTLQHFIRLLVARHRFSELLERLGQDATASPDQWASAPAASPGAEGQSILQQITQSALGIIGTYCVIDARGRLGFFGAHAVSRVWPGGQIQYGSPMQSRNLTEPFNRYRRDVVADAVPDRSTHAGRSRLDRRHTTSPIIIHPGQRGDLASRHAGAPRCDPDSPAARQEGE